MSRIYGRFGARARAACQWFATLCTLLSTFWVRSARAFEDQLSLDLSAGYALVTEAPTLTHTGAFDLGASYGLGPALSLRAAVGGQAWSSAQGGVRPAARALVELTYALDILSIVPAFGIGGSALVLAGGDGSVAGDTQILGGGHVVVSLDYLASRRLNVGVDLREHLLFPLGTPSFASEAKLRLSWLFELF